MGQLTLLKAMVDVAAESGPARRERTIQNNFLFQRMLEKHGADVLLFSLLNLFSKFINF